MEESILKPKLKMEHYDSIIGMQVLGIYIDEPFLRIALIEKTRNRREIIYLKSFLCNESSSVKQLYTFPGRGKIVSAPSSKHILMRRMQVNTASAQHLEQVIAFQSDATSHWNGADVVSVPFILKKDSTQTSALLFTTPKEALKNHLDLLEKWQVDPDLVTAASLALVQYALWKKPHLQSAFLVDLGSEEWTCVCMENGEMKKCHSISGGVESLLAALWEDRKKTLFSKEMTGIAKQIDLLQLQTPLNTHFSRQLEKMRQDLARIIYSFFRLYGQKPIFFTGRVGAFGQMREYLMEHLKESISVDPEIEAQKEESQYAIPIGLALLYHTKAPQFRRGEFFPLKNWKKAGLYAICLIACSLGLGAGMIHVTHSAISAKIDSMATHLKSLIAQEDPLLIPQIFSEEGMEGALERWNHVVALHSKECPYFLKVPKVAEILAWIYQHPLLLEMKKGEGAVAIEKIDYQLLRYPKIDTPQDPYVAKVEIEFSTTSALNARKFHEMLLQGSGPVDASQEIEWEALDQKYRASFFLKSFSPC